MYRFSYATIHPSCKSRSTHCLALYTRPQLTFIYYKNSCFVVVYHSVPAALSSLSRHLMPWLTVRMHNCVYSSSFSTSLPETARKHQEKYYLERLHGKRCWLLQHIPHLCLDFQRLSSSIEHRVSMMLQLSSFLAKYVFRYLSCFSAQRLQLVSKSGPR